MLFLLCPRFTGARVLEVLLRLLGIGFVKRHLVECRFLMLVRVKSSQKLMLQKLHLPVEMGEDQEDQRRAAASLVASSEAFRASGLKVRIFYNWWHSFDGLSPSEHLAFKNSMEKDTVYSALPRTVLTTPRAKRGKQWWRVGWWASQRWWSAKSSLITFATFFREFKVLYPPFPSFPFLSLSLSFPPYLLCLFLFLSILLSVLFSFSFSSLCVVLFSFFSISVISVSFPPSSGYS